MKLDVLTIGGAVRDVIFHTDKAEIIKNPKNLLKQKLFAFEYGAKIYSQDAYFSLGGGAANTAASFSNLGLKVAILAKVGAEVDSQVIINGLKKQKIAINYLTRDKNTPSGFSFLVVDKNTGEHTVFAYRGASDNLEVSPSQLNKINTNWYYLASLSGGNWSKVLEAIFNASVKKGIKIAWNPGSLQLAAGYKKLLKYMKQTTVLNLNKDEAVELVLSKNRNFKGDSINGLLREIYSWGPETIIITNGRKGAHAFDGKKLYFQKALTNPPVDTTGAGDCFGSSFVTGLIKFDGNIQKALQLGAVHTSSVVNEMGSQNGLLKWPQALASMKKNKFIK